MKREHTKRAMSRRECLAAAGTVVLVASAMPVRAEAEPRLTAPPGHDRGRPAFGRVDWEK
jgi:hypothetical protein